MPGSRKVCQQKHRHTLSTALRPNTLCNRLNAHPPHSDRSQLSRGLADWCSYNIDLFFWKRKRNRPNFFKNFYEPFLCKLYYVNIRNRRAWGTAYCNKAALDLKMLIPGLLVDFFNIGRPEFIHSPFRPGSLSWQWHTQGVCAACHTQNDLAFLCRH